jgi:hypothetical protein
MAAESKKYATAGQVCSRYQLSNMTLHRWLKNLAMNFPCPLVINGIVPRSVELYEASAAVNDFKRPSRFEQQRDCLFPFRSEQQARLVRPEVA